jgi:hypothetical protein
MVQKPGTQGIALQQPICQRLGPVEIEHAARARLGVAAIAEEGLDAGAFI